MLYKFSCVLCFFALGGCSSGITPQESNLEDTAPQEVNFREKNFQGTELENIPKTSEATFDPQAVSNLEPPMLPLEAIRNLPLHDADSNFLLRADINRIYNAAASDIGEFQKPITRTLHRVLNPNEQKKNWEGYRAWQSYANEMKYILEEWDNSDLATKELAFSTNVTAGIDAAQDHNRYDIISHLLGMSALSEEGGIWIGSKATPPCIEGKFIDFEKIMRMEGLIIATNQRARRVGGSSIYLTTTFMAASKGHPWVRMIAERASDNTLQMFKSGYSNWPVRYYAGNTFLSRNLAGFYSVLPFTYLQSIGVFSQVTKESEEDALD